MGHLLFPPAAPSKAGIPPAGAGKRWSISGDAHPWGSSSLETSQPWGSSPLGTSGTHLADTGGAVVPIQAEPGSVRVRASPEVALFWEKGKQWGWSAKHSSSLTPSPGQGSSHPQTGGPGITWSAGAAVSRRGAGAGSWGAFRGEAGDIPGLRRGVWGWETGSWFPMKG